MGTILSSKAFEIPKGSIADLTAVDSWIMDNVKDGCRLVLRVETVGKSRQKRKTAIAELEGLAIDAALEDKDVWQQGEYKFLFAARKYCWKGKEVYLTSGEQLYLFKWLVLKDGTGKYCKFYLCNMRRRLGKEFLADVGLDGVPIND